MCGFDEKDLILRAGRWRLYLAFPNFILLLVFRKFILFADLRICEFANLPIGGLLSCWWDYSKFSPFASVSKIYFIWRQGRGKR